MIKVLDFGLAKVKSEGPTDGGLTHEGQMLGTPDYIAPEQIGDARKADIRADIYSLGCTLYYLLTGGPPFQGTSLYDILQAHHSMDAKPLNLARPEVPVELAALVAKMMAKEPDRRFRSRRRWPRPRAVLQEGGCCVQESRSGLFARRSSRFEPPLTGSISVTAQPGTHVEGTSTQPGNASVPSAAEFRQTLVESTESRQRLATTSASERSWRPPWLWPLAAAGVVLLGLAVDWRARFSIPKT